MVCERQTISLTNGTDTATANVFNAGQVYSPGGNDRINSLQDEDVLTGINANPTLNVTLGNTNDNGSLIVTPTLNGIQTINAVFSNTDGTGLDLQDASGLQTVNVTRISSSLSNGAVGSIAAGARVELINLPATALSLDLRNSVAYADVNISYRNGELNGDETVSIDLSSAAIQDLVVGAQAIQTNHINTLVLNVESESHVQNLNLKGGSTEVADQKLVINAAADFILGDDANADGNYLDNNSALWGVDGRLAEIEVTGAGNVTIGEVSTRAAGMTLSGGTATGDIAVNVSNADGVAASSFTTGSGNDTVVSNGLAADLTTNDGNDTVTVGGNITLDSTVSLGAGNDALTVGAGAVNSQNVMEYTGQLAGGVNGGAQVDMGEGDNTVILGDSVVDGVGVSIAEEAKLNFGAGNDTVTLSGSITGDTVGGTDGEDDTGGELNMGDGDNTVVFNLEGATNQGTLINGLVTAGTGTNTMTVQGNANATVVASNAANADRVTGFQTLNLVSMQSVDAVLEIAVDTAAGFDRIDQNDDDLATANYTVDVAEFTGLTAINMDNQAGIINATPEEAAASNFEGDDATYTITNLTGAEALTLAATEGATGVAGARTVGGVTAAQIAADTTADATVNMTRATAGAVAITLNEGVDGTGGDVTLADENGVAGVVGEGNITTINVTVNGDDSRTLVLSNGDFATAANLDGNMAAGSTLTVNGGAVGVGIEALTFTSTLAANVNATFDNVQNHTITTGAGNDVIDLILDTANGSDTINLGDGTDRIIVNDDLRGNTGADADEYFNGYTSIEELELRGGGVATEFTTGVAGTMEVTLDDDAQTAGVNRVILSEGTGVVGAPGANAVVDLALGVDFENDLRIDMAKESTLTIDNDADVDLDIRMNTVNSTGDNTLALTDAGLGTVAITVTVDAVAQAIGQAGGAPTNDVIITNADNTAEIDSIVLLDSNASAGGAPAVGGDQTGAIVLTAHNTWAQAGDTLTINASDINDDDRANALGVVVDSDNQTVTIDASTDAAIAYKVNVTGSQMVDTITGTAQGDTIDGQDGNDTITGGVGADTLTGGAGADTFVYNSVNDSRGVSGVDTITDFTTGTDKLQIAVNMGAVRTANLGRFNNTAATVGSGLVELDGAPAPGTAIIDAGFSTDGMYFIDLDGDGNINNTTDLRINVGTVNAGDINYVVTGTGGADLIRGGQGADQITGGAGADVFVMVGSITSAQANAYLTAEVAVPGSVIPAALANVLDISELTTVRTQSEINTGDWINRAGEVGADTLHVFGTADLTLINNGGALNVTTLVVHSDITLSVAQLNALGAVPGTLEIDGDTAHTIKVVRVVGGIQTQLSSADVASVLNGTYVDPDLGAIAPPAIVVSNAGDNTTIQLGSTAAAVNAETFVTTTVPAATTEGLTITSAMTADEIEAALTGGTLAEVDATGMTAAQLIKVATSIIAHADKVAEITGTLAITNGLSAAQITALFDEYTGTTATADITGMTNLQIAELDNAKIAANGITGSVTDMNAAALAALLTKAADIADNSLTGNLSMSTVAAADQIALLAKYAGTTATADATGMTLANHNSLIAAAAKISSIINLALTDGKVDDAADITALLAKATGATVDAAGMSDAKENAVLAGLAKVDTVDNLTLTQTQWDAVVAASAQAALNTALVDGESLVITAGTAGAVVNASAITQGVTINVGGTANVLTGGAGVDTFVIDASSGGFTAASGLSITGDGSTDVLAILGTSAVDLSGATALTSSVETLDLSGDDADVTLTAAQLNAFTTVTAAGGDTITVNTLNGATVTATGGDDVFVFAATDTGVTINGFATTTDKLDFSTFLGAAPSALVAVVADDSTGDQVVADGNILRVTDAGDDLDAAGIAALFGGSSDVFGAITTGDKYVLITNAGKIWYLDTALDTDNTNLTAADIVQVGTIGLVTLTDLGDSTFGI